MADASQLATEVRQLAQRLDRMESQFQSKDDDDKREFAALRTDISEQAEQVNDQQEAMEHLMEMLDNTASTDVSVCAFVPSYCCAPAHPLVSRSGLSFDIRAVRSPG